ncbi:C2H2-type domain-containing protein [Aphis craccivora]|uniref:C2H2-type domain-containing protein n=1 Tax=Aphis craccivora TaxID=307492 RepID=A0A6G0YHV4_APHCR|nr:C2H2-type domain-containing protein [Aphis craccivora]
MNNSFKKNIKTQAGLLSAMTFGKYSGIDPNSKRIKLVGNKRIGTQPTARHRRKTEIGGRKNLTAGRVPKWKRIPELSYGQEPKSSYLPKKQKSFNSDAIPTKPYKNPHNLAHCTSQNKTLETTHCKK